MARFYFSPCGNLIVVNNAAYRDDFYVEETSGYLIVNVTAENTAAAAYVPLYAVVGVSEGAVKVFGKLKLTDWGNGNYEVTYSLEKYPFYAPTVTLAENYYNFSGGSFSAAVERGAATSLVLTRDKTPVVFALPDLENPVLFFRPTGVGFLTVLSAKCGDKEYLLLILYDGKFEKLFELIADKIDFSDKSFIVTEDFKDMLGRRRKTEYYFAGKALKAKKLEFTYACDKTYPDGLTPYLLLEAVQAKDMRRAKSYLSDDLINDAEKLVDYFGDFKAACCPKYPTAQKISDLNKVALLYDTSCAVAKPRIFTFEISDGKISNISD